MATESVTILKVGTEDAVKNVQDLKDNIKVLKENLNDLDIGSQEYQKTLTELKENQNALKNAMYATADTGKTAEENMKDLSAAAKGQSETYNGLVAQMAKYKETLRTIDVSTNEGKEQFKEMAEKIDDVNSKLKAMDALQGNYQRNVGNYQSAFKGLGDKVDGFGKGLKAAKGGADALKGALDGASKTPALVLFGLLASAVSSLVSNFKESEEGTKSMQAAMVNIEPVINVVKNIIAKLSEVLGDVIAKVSEFLSSSGLLNKVIQGVVGVGNAIMKFVIAPFKGVIAAIKVFKEEGVKGFQDAGKAFAEEMKSGVAFKSNFEAGQAVGEALTKGIKSKRKEALAAVKEILKDMEKETIKIDDVDVDVSMGDDALTKKQQVRLSRLEKYYKQRADWNAILEDDERTRAENEYAIQSELNEKKLALLQQYAQEALQAGNIDEYLAYEQEAADLSVEIEMNATMEKKRLRDLDAKDAEARAKANISTMQSVASATASILGSIADMYEADEKNAEKNAEKVKALRIVEATINTISGAIGAFMQASATIPPPAGLIVGAVQAAAVTAAGIAQIANIKKQQVGSSSVSSISSASVSAPNVTTEVENVRSVTSASEEERLNDMAKDQRVYILQSDIEASGEQSKVRVAEASF